MDTIAVTLEHRFPAGREVTYPSTASTRSRDGWPKVPRSNRRSGGRPWPASSTSDSSDRATGRRWAQLMERVDDQGHDVAALTRAVTRTALNDLPRPGSGLPARRAPRPRRRPATAPRCTPRRPRPRHDRDRTEKLPRPSWQRRGRPSLTQRFLSALALPSSPQR
jgi:hypothetical protein